MHRIEADQERKIQNKRRSQEIISKRTELSLMVRKREKNLTLISEGMKDIKKTIVKDHGLGKDHTQGPNLGKGRKTECHQEKLLVINTRKQIDQTHRKDHSIIEKLEIDQVLQNGQSINIDKEVDQIQGKGGRTKIEAEKNQILKTENLKCHILETEVQIDLKEKTGKGQYLRKDLQEKDQDHLVLN